MYCIRATYIPRNDMFFDADYYMKKHVPLAMKQMEGRVSYERTEVEFNVRTLMEEDEITSPCIFSVYVGSKEEIENFREIRTSPAGLPLKEDMKNYTNCESVWTVSDIAEL